MPDNRPELPPGARLCSRGREITDADRASLARFAELLRILPAPSTTAPQGGPGPTRVIKYALSIRRPWAQLILAGHKQVENRSWTTSHRGEIVIHAGRTWVPDGAQLAADLGLTGFASSADCPSGYLGTVHLADTHPAEGGCCAPWGQPKPGTFHWVLTDPQPFDQPRPGPGQLGLYRLPAVS